MRMIQHDLGAWIAPTRAADHMSPIISRGRKDRPVPLFHSRSRGPASIPLQMVATVTLNKNRCVCAYQTEHELPEEGRAMPLFACSKCNCVEDTALCHYWGARLRQTAAVCSACDPAIGEWHGEFPREPAEGFVNDRHGFLLDKRSVERWLGQAIEIFAKPERRPSARDCLQAHVLALDSASY
ncbi:MAG TPA: hypothetical protein VIY51_24755 [Xanthobacteraceae bacterium]